MRDRDYTQEALDALAQFVLSKRSNTARSPAVARRTIIVEPSQYQDVNDPDLAWLISKESGGRTSAKNPKSSAFGVGQLLSANRRQYAAQLGISNPDTTDYAEQLKMMTKYIKDRYGSPKAARTFHQQHGWY